MKTLLENPYLTVHHLPEEGILDTVWHTRLDMGDEAYREVFIQYLKASDSAKAPYIVIDAVDATYPLTPEVQEWIVSIMGDYDQGHIKKMAHIMAAELITSLSVEQVMDEIKPPYETRYFSDKNEALAWLRS